MTHKLKKKKNYFNFFWYCWHFLHIKDSVSLLIVFKNCLSSPWSPGAWLPVAGGQGKGAPFFFSSFCSCATVLLLVQLKLITPVYQHSQESPSYSQLHESESNQSYSPRERKFKVLSLFNRLLSRVESGFQAVVQGGKSNNIKYMFSKFLHPTYM